MHTLSLLERLSSVDYTSLSLMRELKLWDLIYSSAFFGFAEEQVMQLLSVCANAHRNNVCLGAVAWMIFKNGCRKKLSQVCYLMPCTAQEEHCSRQVIGLRVVNVVKIFDIGCRYNCNPRAEATQPSPTAARQAAALAAQPHQQSGWH